MDIESSSEGKNEFGLKLLEAAAGKELSSLRFRKENLAILQEVNAIVVVGSSFTGKSTLVDAIREAQQDNSKLAVFSIPKRVVTRPPRANENFVENDFVSPERFGEMVQAGEIGLHWTRKMEGTRTERYGFLKPEKGKIPIYSANNAVINNNESVEPVGALDNALLVAVYARESERVDRLRARSQDLVMVKPREAEYRLSDRAANMYPNTHVVVKNFGKYKDRAKNDMVALVELVALIR